MLIAKRPAVVVMPQKLNVLAVKTPFILIKLSFLVLHVLIIAKHVMHYPAKLALMDSTLMIKAYAVLVLTPF